MKAPTRGYRFGTAPLGQSGGGGKIGPAGLWALVDGEAVEIARTHIGPAIVLMPSERVLLRAVDLPLPTPRRRIEALPFALEEDLAQPLDAIHIAIGAEVEPGQYLAAAVDHADMASAVAAMDASGLSRAALLPDALTVRRPPAGRWGVDRKGERVLVRTADGAGFALPYAQLRLAWDAGGRPPCLSYGDAIATDMVVEGEAPGPAAQLTSAPLDLRQGIYTRQRARLPVVWRRLAIVVAGGLVAHGAIAAADTLALRRIAQQREAETRALIAIAAPSRAVAPDGDVVDVATSLLPAAGAAGGESGLLPLLTRTSAALTAVASQITVRQMEFDRTQQSLTLDLDAADVAGLQKVEAAIRAGGLVPTSGSAEMEGGRAHGKIVVRRDAGGGAS